MKQHFTFFPILEKDPPRCFDQNLNQDAFLLSFANTCPVWLLSFFRRVQTTAFAVTLRHTFPVGSIEKVTGMHVRCIPEDVRFCAEAQKVLSTAAILPLSAFTMRAKPDNRSVSATFKSFCTDFVKSLILKPPASNNTCIFLRQAATPKNINFRKWPLQI